MAFAEGDLADMLSSASAGAKSGKTSGTEIAQRSEYSSSSVPCWLSKVGTNPQITVGRCCAGLAIGGLLAVVPEVMSRTQKQLGTSSVNIS